MKRISTETANSADGSGAVVMKNAAQIEGAGAEGVYTAVCRDAQGNIKWEEVIENLVTTVGKNLALDTFLAGSAYTATSFVGLCSGTPTPAGADTMASHAGWTEVGGTNAPAYTGARKAPAWNAASAGAKATSSIAAYSFTSGGTVGGCFLVIGAGAASTLDNTGGTLYSIGAFTGGNKTVASGDSLTVTYTASL